MSATPSPTPSEFYAGLLPVEVPAVGAADPKSDQFQNGRPSLGTRAMLALLRFLIAFCIGVAAALAWQSYGDTAREMIVSSYPQLGWLALQPAPIAQSAADMTAPATPSHDQQQLNAMSLNLDAVRQSVDRIAASQEQITRSVDQLAAGQEQITREITKLQAVEKYVLYRNSEPLPLPRPAPVPTRNPAMRPSQVPAVR